MAFKPINVAEEFPVIKHIHSSSLRPKQKWTMPMINTISQKMFGYCIEDLYDYETFNGRCVLRLSSIGPADSPKELDQYMWEEFTEYLEESRLFVFNTYVEEGVSECESYFQSLKFLYSVLKKFRGKFYKEFEGENKSREDYDAAPLKTAINYLMHHRLKRIMAPDSYKYSTAAASDQLGNFKTDCAWACAEHLAEETGVIFHAKVTLY